MPRCRPGKAPRGTPPQRLDRVLGPIGMPRRPSAALSARANPSVFRPSHPLIAVLALLAAMSFGRLTLARQGGIAAEGCDGCHRGGMVPTVSLTSDTSQIEPNQSLTLTISVSATNGPAAGFYIHCSVGTFQVIDPGTRATAPDGVTHSAPRVGSGSENVFTVGWTAPNQLGGVNFNAYGVSANNNGMNTGDGAGSAAASFSIGCTEGTTYYRDFDG